MGIRGWRVAVARRGNHIGLFDYFAGFKVKLVKRCPAHYDERIVGYNLYGRGIRPAGAKLFRPYQFGVVFIRRKLRLGDAHIVIIAAEAAPIGADILNIRLRRIFESNIEFSAVRGNCAFFGDITVLRNSIGIIIFAEHAAVTAVIILRYFNSILIVYSDNGIRR